ncbi:helix-turn-helix domain-containing protein [Rhodovibrionaceae bacterium A322]
MRQQIDLKDAEEIADFLYAATGMIPGYTQFSAGTANLRYRTLDLPGLSLLWARGQAHCRWQDQMSDDGRVHFGFVLEADKSVLSQGHELGPQDAMLFLPGQEMDYIFTGPVLTLEIAVSRALVHQLGWQFSGAPLARVPGTHLQALGQLCAQLDQQISQMLSPPSPAFQLAARDQILDALEQALAPWLPTGKGPDLSRPAISRGHKTLQNAERIFRHSDDKALSMTELARQSGVSPRTLYYAFRQSLGLTPREYFEILRLNQLRQNLMDADPASQSVTRLATELGFGDLGRLASRYHARFGEYPSQTLKA